MLVGKGSCPKIIWYKNKKVPPRKETANALSKNVPLVENYT
jgi:hypothetical protein